MTDGSSQGLFVVVAVVIFGIFVAINYTLFRDTLTPSLASIFKDSTEISNKLMRDTYYKGANLYTEGRTERDHTNIIIDDNWGSEYTQHGDVSPIFNLFGEGKYTISFDLYTEVPGAMLVYSQNGYNRHYRFANEVQVTSGWGRYSVVVDVKKEDPTSPFYHESLTLLSFYGTYGSGRNSTVKNVKIELGEVSGVPSYEDAPSDLVY